jgi:hypothetical protein
MNERIPILYACELKPEWIDYALEQSLQVSNKEEMAKVLRDYLREQIKSDITFSKTVGQLQQVVGFRSTLSRQQLKSYYDQMSKLSPEQRISVRFHLLLESSQFVNDVVQALRKLHVIGSKEIAAGQLYERIIAKYGDRGPIPRRVRYVLQTLNNLGVIANKNSKWVIINLD